jgi:transcriptional regulator with XRE-family HTH domain
MKETVTVLGKLAKRIRFLRTERRMTQEALAEKSGLHTTLIGKIERGNCNPSLITLDKIARGLGMPLCDLLKFDEESRVYSQNARKLEDLLENISLELKTALQYVRGFRM